MTAGPALLARAADDAQDVVARLAEAVGAEQGLVLARQRGGGADDVEIGLLCGKGEGRLLADLVLELAGRHAESLSSKCRENNSWVSDRERAC